MEEASLYLPSSGGTKKAKVKPLNYSQVTIEQQGPDDYCTTGLHLPFYSILRMQFKNIPL
jgi:hypothetical protein